MNLKSSTLTIAGLFFFFTFSVFAQQQDTIPWTGKQLIDSGIKFYDKGEYAESLKYFSRVSKCDPAYASACYESALAYEDSKDFALGFLKINEADSLEPNHVGTITMKGSLLDDLERRQEAIELLENARKKWPYNHNLLYNLAIVYVNILDYAKAEQILTECVKLAPYHAGTHFLLGQINYRMGRTAQSVLAYNMGLIMNPSSSNVTKFERTVTGQTSPRPQAYLYPYSSNYDASQWKELTRYCNSGIAFRKDFPYDAFCNFIINRQSLLLFRLMNFNENDTTIYNQFYVRFFKEILNRNEINPMFGLQLQNIDNKLINDWNKSNETKRDKFIKFAQTCINDWREYAFSFENEKNKIKTHLFNDNGKLNFIGKSIVAVEPVKEGDYIIIDKSGYVSEKGTYKNNQLTGLCAIYWPNGNVKQQLNFTDGELDGINKTFHENSNLSGIYPREKGKTQGTEIQYSLNSRIVRKQSFVNDLAQGNCYNLYTNSGFSVDSKFDKGKLQGKFVEKWINGVIKTEGNYVDSLMNGTIKKWFANGKPESVNEAKNNYFVGPFTLYHTNGVKKSEGVYDDSTRLHGNYAEYSNKGKLIMIQTGYVNGKLNGIQTDYYENGNKKDEYFYNNDCIDKIICYDPNGAVIYKTETQNGMIGFRHYFDSGVLKREGNFLNGKRHGEWHELSGGGVIVSLENWKENMQFGPQKTFYQSGTLKTEFYCDSDKIEGPYKEYFPNGNLKSIAYYHKGVGTGLFNSFYSTGAKMSEFYLENNQITGRRFDYTPNGNIETISEYDEDNTLTQIAYYINGKFLKKVPFTQDSVMVQVNYPNGKPMYKYKLLDGLKEGIAESYYPNAKISEQQIYINGKLNGTSKQWDMDGNLASLLTYCMDKVEGYSYIYDNAKLNNKDYYEDGKEQQDYREYYLNGKILRIIPYVDGEREGEYCYFAPDSTKLFSFNYQAGSICSLTIRNKSGKTEIISSVNTGAEIITSYYPNGAVAAQIPLVKGYLNGTLTLFYPNGNKLRERVYKNDYLNGMSVDYYSNGKIKESVEFANDDKNGKYVYCNELGVKLQEGTFVSDARNGEWAYFDASGKLRYKAIFENDRAYEIK